MGRGAGWDTTGRLATTYLGALTELQLHLGARSEGFWFFLYEFTCLKSPAVQVVSGSLRELQLPHSDPCPQLLCTGGSQEGVAGVRRLPLLFQVACPGGGDWRCRVEWQQLGCLTFPLDKAGLQASENSLFAQWCDWDARSAV